MRLSLEKGRPHSTLAPNNIHHLSTPHTQVDTAIATSTPPSLRGNNVTSNQKQ
jgi:hypothetical protein